MPKKYVEMIEVPAAETNETASCTFFMLDAQFVRNFPGKRLPFLNEIRKSNTEAVREVTLNYAEVVSGTHVEKILSVSHRWMTPEEPDPDGEQLKTIKTFLNSSDGRKIELMWIDAGSMPQDQPKGSRSEADTANFKRMLREVNMLYLGTSVLILLDLSYVSRCKRTDCQLKHAVAVRSLTRGLALSECDLLVCARVQSGLSSRRG